MYFHFSLLLWQGSFAFSSQFPVNCSRCMLQEQVLFPAPHRLWVLFPGILSDGSFYDLYSSSTCMCYQYSAEYSGGPSAHLQSSLPVQFSPPKYSALWTLVSFVSLDSQLHFFTSESLPGSSWVSRYSTAWKLSHGSKLEHSQDSHHLFPSP